MSIVHDISVAVFDSLPKINHTRYLAREIHKHTLHIVSFAFCGCLCREEEFQSKEKEFEKEKEEMEQKHMREQMTLKAKVKHQMYICYKVVAAPPRANIVVYWRNGQHKAG